MAREPGVTTSAYLAFDAPASNKCEVDVAERDLAGRGTSVKPAGLVAVRATGLITCPPAAQSGFC
jgi:hypothetical protein